MLNQQKYIEAIYSAIDKHFKNVDSSIHNCKELSKAYKEYRQALKELHSGIDNVVKYPEKYQAALESAKVKIARVNKDINGAQCDGYRTIEPLTVGLFGEWGSGKTYLLKGLKNILINSQEVLKTANDTPDEKLIIPIFFNAWRFEKDEYIIIPLFQTLLSELENYDYIPAIKQIKTKIKILLYAITTNLNASAALDIARGFIVGDPVSLESIFSFFNLKGAFKKYKEEKKKEDKSYQLGQLLSSERIESVYMKIPEWIEKITILDNVRFVFLIDDLDRCLPENTLKMLESMKLFLDVAGCSFVLAIDDDVVERGVEHHYRDYLHRNDNYIFLNSSSSNASADHPGERRALPITGSEYLEKIVQLPFRIPPIDNSDVKSFLENRYERFKPKVQEPLKDREYSQSDNESELLEFFAKNIPPKPRKIIRAINLFEYKEELMKGLNPNRVLLAKITLLELFAPKLYRFMLNKGFERTFKRLVSWREKYKSLSEVGEIREDITSEKIPQIDKDIFLFIVGILKELYKGRVDFNLDEIFKEEVDDKILTLHSTFKATLKETISKKELLYASPEDTQLFLERLLSSDELLWEDAFSEDKNLAQRGAVLDRETFDKLLQELEEQQKGNLTRNVQWLKSVALHLSDDDFKALLKKYKPFLGKKELQKENIKLLETITNRLNPRYKKEIQEIPESIIPRRVLKQGKQEYLNVRGLGLSDKDCTFCDRGAMRVEDATALQELPQIGFGPIASIAKIDNHTLACGGGDRKVTLIDISSREHPKTLGSVGFENLIESITTIDNNTLACGGFDSKVTLIDISSREHPKSITSYMFLEDAIYEIVNRRNWILFNKNGWQYNNDEKLYRYARLYDPKSKRLVPYFDIEGERVSYSKDKTELIIKRKKNS